MNTLTHSVIKGRHRKFIKVDAAESGIDKLKVVNSGTTLASASCFNDDNAHRYADGAVFYERVGVYETREVVTPGLTSAPLVNDVLKTACGLDARIVATDYQPRFDMPGATPYLAMLSLGDGHNTIVSFAADGGSRSGYRLVLPTTPEKREKVTKFWPEEA